MKKRRKKRRSRFLFLKIFLILAVIGSLSAAFIVNFCKTQDVKIIGNKIAPTDEIQQAVLTDPRDENAVYATVRCFFTKHAVIPFVQSYTVSMNDLNTLVIRVKEKELSGYLMNEKGDRYIYYGPDGKVQETSERLIKGVFFVEGLTVADAKAGEPVSINESDSKTIISLQNELEREKLKVKKVHFSQEGVITFNLWRISGRVGSINYF